MSIYPSPGAALLECQKCHHAERVEWRAGDMPIFIPVHCGQQMAQVTHNDGVTPLDRPCTAGCCVSGVHPTVVLDAARKLDAL